MYHIQMKQTTFLRFRKFLLSCTSVKNRSWLFLGRFHPYFRSYTYKCYYFFLSFNFSTKMVERLVFLFIFFFQFFCPQIAFLSAFTPFLTLLLKMLETHQFSSVKMRKCRFSASPFNYSPAHTHTHTHKVRTHTHTRTHKHT